MADQLPDLELKVEALFRDPRTSLGWNVEQTFELLADLAATLAEANQLQRDEVLSALIDTYQELFLHTILHVPTFAATFRRCAAKYRQGSKP